jgi:hypothetical protein
MAGQIFEKWAGPEYDSNPFLILLWLASGAGNNASAAELLTKQMALCASMEYAEQLAHLCLEDSADISNKSEEIAAHIAMLFDVIQYQKITEYELKRATIKQLNKEHPEDIAIQELGASSYDIY